MLKSVFATAALLGLSTAMFATARADAPVEIYTCVFTEPFFNFSYNSDTGELRKSTPKVPMHVETNVHMSADDDGKLLLTDRHGTLLYTLEFKPGSNGMSNRVYPYEGVTKTTVNGPAGQIGGCYSTSHPLE